MAEKSPEQIIQEELAEKRNTPTQRAIDDALEGRAGRIDEAVASLPDTFEMPRYGDFNRFAGDTPEEQYRQFKFHPQPVEGEHGLFENRPTAPGKGYTVNLDSLAVRVGELTAVAEAVAEAARTFTSCGGGNLGPGGIDAAVAKVGSDWSQNMARYREKLDAMSADLQAVQMNYYGCDDNAWQRFAVDGQERFTEKFGEGD